MNCNYNSFGDDNFGENIADEALSIKSEVLINENNDVAHHRQDVDFTSETSADVNKGVRKRRKTSFEMKDKEKKKLLVELVKGEELIWNKQHASHWNSKAMSAAWKRIADKMPDTPVYQCRAMWKSLKDALRYQKQKKYEKMKGSDYWSEHELQRESELRDLLYFLTPTVTEGSRRDSNSNNAEITPLTNLNESVDDSITDLVYNNSVKINSKQKIILFDAMSRNRDILDGRWAESGTRQSRNDLWEKLAAKLNVYGPEKDITQWKKCWSDLRLFMRKKYQKKKNPQSRRLTENEKRIIQACGIQYGENEDYDESESDNNVVQVVEVVEEIDIKQEQYDDGVPLVFEIVDVPSETITNDQVHSIITDDSLQQQTINGAIKIEDIPFSSEDKCHEPNSVHSSMKKRRSKMQCRSKNNFQRNPEKINLNSNAIEFFPDEAIIEIRKMHRCLLRESKKQTALLEKLVSRIAQ